MRIKLKKFVWQNSKLFKKITCWICIGILFLFITFLHMGQSLTQCSTTVLGNPGDHTAGIMYNSWVEPNRPVLSHSGYTNYPFGEDLWQPLAISSILPSTAHLVLSKATNAVCGWNLLVLLSYMSYALFMFAFIRWLLGNSLIAFFAAYAITFTPYHIFSSKGQISGLLGSIFILAFWQYLSLMRHPTKLKGAFLGITIGAGFYTDGYFVLLGLVLLLGFWVSTLLYRFTSFSAINPNTRDIFTTLSIASLMAGILLSPLVWIHFNYTSQINSIFDNARGDIMADAQIYSATPSMYLSSSSLIFIGYTVITLALIGVLFTIKDTKITKKMKNGFRLPVFAGWTSIVITTLAFWVSLRPKTIILDMEIYTPSALIISLTSSWRVFGRLYIIVIIGVVTLAAIGLKGLTDRYNGRFWITLVCLLLLAFDLRAVFPTPANPTFDFRNTPYVYSWLKNNPDIRAIAEYPLDEPPQGQYLSDYLTFQEVSHKPILNTLLTNSPEASLRRSIMGINDPQTLPVLRALGIELVNIRPITSNDNYLDTRHSALSNKELTRIHSHENGLKKIDSFIIKPGKIANYALEIQTLQYFQIFLTPSGTAKYMVDDDTKLTIFKLPNAVEKDLVQVEFYASSDTIRRATVLQNGVALWNGSLTTLSENISFEASPHFPMTLYTERSLTPTHITLSDMRIVE